AGPLAASFTRRLKYEGRIPELCTLELGSPGKPHADGAPPPLGHSGTRTKIFEPALFIFNSHIHLPLIRDVAIGLSPFRGPVKEKVGSQPIVLVLEEKLQR